jgi:hypothetical protein
MNRLFVIVLLDGTIQCFMDSPIKSGNDCMVLTYDVGYNFIIAEKNGSVPKCTFIGETSHDIRSNSS